MDCSRSSYLFAGPCKTESFDPSDSRMSIHHDEVLDLQYRPPKIELDSDDVATGIDNDNQDVAPATPMNCFRLGDEEAVCSYLRTQLLLLQQQAGKRIAKLWIKGICPKKQARYPYKSKQQKEGQDPDPRIPEWWPIHLCKFTEPDHIDKQSRMDLCLHLLRLRASSRQLNKWNADLHGPNKTLETRGWTAFLQELTPLTTLDGLGKSPESEEKVKQRQKILNDMYEIAGKEEEFIKGERDDDVIYFEDYEDALTMPSKKSHAKKRAVGARESKGSNAGRRREKKGKYTAGPAPQKKKGRTTKAVKVEMVDDRDRIRPGSMSLDMYHEQVDRRGVSKPNRKPIRSNHVGLMPTMGNLPVEYPSQFIPYWSTIGQSTSSEQSSPTTASFSASQSDQEETYNSFRIFDAPTYFPGQPDFQFEDPAHKQNIFHVHNVRIPQPYFENVPNTPTMSPSKLTPFPPGGVWPPEYHVAPAMERYPGPLSTSYMSAVMKPVTASQAHTLPGNISGVQGAFMEQPGRRSITPTSDAQSAYEGFPSIECDEQQYHGLPASYRRNYSTPDENGQPLPFGYPEATPDADFPAAALPGSVTRGFTGTSSGVSGGAWT